MMNISASYEVLAQLTTVQDPQAALAKALSLTRQTVGADLIMVLKQHNPLTIQCIHNDPADPVCNLLTMSSVCERAIAEDRPEFIEDYRSEARPNKLLTSWGAVSVAILPIHSASFIGVVLLVWKQPAHLRTAVQHLLLSMLSYFRSVLPHQELTKQLNATKDLLASILKSIPQGVVFVDSEGLEGWINAPAGRMLQLSSQGRVTPLEVSAAMHALRNRPRAGEATEQPIIEISNLDLNSDSMAGQLWVLNDVTQSFQQSRQLHEKTEQLTTANKDLQATKNLLEAKVAARTRELAEAVEQLQSRNEALCQSEERLRMATDVTGLGIWDLDVINNKMEASSFCRAAYGILPDAPISVEDFLIAVHPDDRMRVQEAIEVALDPEGNGKYRIDYRTIGVCDQVLRYVHAEAQTVFTKDGETRKAIRIVGTTLDVTISERSKNALLRANNDLRQFAYAAAHDLQEPLRNVSTSLGLLKRSLQGQLAEHSAELISESIEGAQRMHNMVKDLLSFSTITERRKDIDVSTDAQTVLEQTLKNLSRSIAEASATITCDPLPRVEMEETHLLQLFQNLLGNSLKYRRNDASLHIQVAAERYPGEWRFSITDNGIGFDPMYAQRIFGIFKRLHGRQQYPGSGIGLAICSRIVALYGGAIWAEGQEGVGAKFFFTVPIQQQASK